MLVFLSWPLQPLTCHVRDSLDTLIHMTLCFLYAMPSFSITESPVGNVPAHLGQCIERNIANVVVPVAQKAGPGCLRPSPVGHQWSQCP